MPNGIPDKGRILTALSLFWLELPSEFANHLLATERPDYPAELGRSPIRSTADRCW